METSAITPAAWENHGRREGRAAQAAVSAGVRLHRRAVLGGGAAALLASAAEPMAKHRFRNVLSVGMAAEQVLANGVVFSDGVRQAASVADLQRMFIAHGATEVYARIGTSRTGRRGTPETSLARGVTRARLAKSLGLALDPEIGLWRIYGGLPDFSEYPGLRPPGRWDQISVEQMVPVVRDFGAIVAEAILATGVRVNCWHLSGDERGIGGVTMPRLGPFGRETPYWPPNGVNPEIGRVDVAAFERLSEAERTAWYAKHLWPHTGRLWAALADGVRSVDRAARFTTHTGSGPRAAYEPILMKGFFTALDEAGYRVDEPGACFFPSNAAEPADRMATFQAAIGDAHVALGRRFFIAEHAYPVSPISVGERWDNPTSGYPISPEGQAALTRDLVAWGARTGALSGVRTWSPDAVGGGWGPMCLFELKGAIAVARPGLDAVRTGLAGPFRTRSGSSAPRGGRG